MLTREPTEPYDRVKLSKALSTTANELRLRSTEYYDSGDIEIWTNCEVVGDVLGLREGLNVGSPSERAHHTTPQRARTPASRGS